MISHSKSETGKNLLAREALYQQSVLEKHSLFRSIIASRPFQRLKRVRFLGAIDYFATSDKNSTWFSTSRFEHSIAVAHLAMQSCRILHLSDDIVHEIVAAALLHDIGHGAFSHSIEPYFRQKYGFTHKDMSESIIYGDLFIGNEIPTILYDHAISPKEVLEQLQRSDRDKTVDFFHTPLNVDTIDGIRRAAICLGEKVDWGLPELETLLRLSFLADQEHQEIGDRFWRLKHKVYGSYIHDPKWSIYDHMMNSILDRTTKQVSPHDFLLDDREFEDRFSDEIECVKKELTLPPLEACHLMVQRYDWGKAKPRRDFLVNTEHSIKSRSDIVRRYKQVRGTDELFGLRERDLLPAFHRKEAFRY